MARVTLIFPPFWDPTYPYLGLPALSAFLKQHGHSCTKIDLNLDFVYELFSPQFISSMTRRVEAGLASAAELPALNEDQKDWYRSLVVGSAIGEDEATAAAQNALEVLKDEELFFDPRTLRRALDDIDLVAALLRSAYWPAQFRLPEWSIEIGNSGSSSAAALALARDEVANPFYSFLDSFVRNRLPDDAQIIGIAISYPQLVPALTLARLIRKAGHEAKIVLGGGLVAKILPGILASEPFFEHVDAFVSGEGELPLLELARRCDALESWDGIAGVAVEPGGDAESIGMQPLPMDRVPTPDFDGLPLDRYLSPRRVLPVASARGCYWDRCTFCARRRLYSGGYRGRSSTAIVTEMQELATRYDSRHPFFCDESLSPKMVAECSDLLLARGLDYAWGGWLRFERGFTREIWQKAARSGFCYALAGMESFSAETLKRMRKGSTPRIIAQQIDDMVASCVHPALFIMVGFPGESEELCQETIDFLVEHRTEASVYSVSPFSIDVLSEVWLDQESFGVSPVAPLDPDLDLCVYLPPECYSVEQTIDWNAMKTAREEILAGVTQDPRFRQAMFLYSARGEAEILMRAGLRAPSPGGPEPQRADMPPAEALYLGEDVRVVPSDFDLDDETSPARLPHPVSLLVKYRAGEAFVLDGQLATVLAEFNDDRITLEDLNRVWNHHAKDSEDESFTLERFIQLGSALGIFEQRPSRR